MIIINLGDNANKQKLHIMEFGASLKEDNFWGPGVRDYYTVHFILEGEGYFNGELLTNQNFFISSPYQKIHYFPKKSNPWNYLWILIRGDNVKEFLSAYGLTSENSVGIYTYCKQLSQIRDLIFVDDIGFCSNETAENWAKIIFSLNLQLPTTSNVTSVKEKHLAKATEFIKTKYHSGLTPKKVAEFVNLDEKYLYSLFKTFLGISIQEYLNGIKIEKAKTLLENSTLNISEIAYSLGIDDPLHFSKFFKKFVGVSPKEYRKKK